MSRREMVLREGIEPSTSPLPRGCSTTGPPQHGGRKAPRSWIGWGGRVRTCDFLNQNQVPYQLGHSPPGARRRVNGSTVIWPAVAGRPVPHRWDPKPESRASGERAWCHYDGLAARFRPSPRTARRFARRRKPRRRVAAFSWPGLVLGRVSRPKWWSEGESNPWPSECHSDALPTELSPRWRHGCHRKNHAAGAAARSADRARCLRI